MFVLVTETFPSGFTRTTLKWSGELHELQKIYRRTKSWSFVAEWSKSPFPEPTWEELEKWNIVTTATVYLAPLIFEPGLRVNVYPKYLVAKKNMGTHTMSFCLDIYNGYACVYEDVKEYRYMEE